MFDCVDFGALGRAGPHWSRISRRTGIGDRVAADTIQKEPWDGHGKAISRPPFPGLETPRYIARIRSVISVTADPGDTIMAGFNSVSGRPISERVVYWATTALVTAELGVGGAWDVLRMPQVRQVVDHLGYPSYFLVILGSCKLLGMITLLAPGFPLLKEWAYAGVVFTDTGAIASHLITGYALGELAILIPLLGLTVLSWWSRPASRRLPSSGDRWRPDRLDADP
jgi:hypothetical protein